ncbi:hypothetical protein VTJ04DRAFT_5676 [Mycothermus thermophilus]|uniref:uncharacterized protein n=1 Tax=Humicola insolens TaxID=85995 RepID=UPI00374243EE
MGPLINTRSRRTVGGNSEFIPWTCSRSFAVSNIIRIDQQANVQSRHDSSTPEHVFISRLRHTNMPKSDHISDCSTSPNAPINHEIR